ncbi:hypothetical protein L0B52_09120 [Suttonella sp. R2A3]|uniref:hypothetical protein n=1 Tax=Suttonella sp. R2A3 TaxID=2908648 RepID=UPI001F2B0F0A|nr:hypothetical protein [Suttonella sp. R2A3]UJF24471.1 hypothetical protein L0B52_09120 [Suttonella sp. R2A3]
MMFLYTMGMKYWLTLVFILLMTAAHAVTITLYVGDGKVAGSTLQDAKLVLESDNWRDWRLTGGLDQLRRANETLKGITLEGAGSYDKSNLQVDELSLRATWRESILQLSTDAFEIVHLLDGTSPWPEDLVLHIRGKGESLDITGEYAGNNADADLRARLPAAWVNDWLAAAGLEFPPINGTLVPDVQLTRRAGQWRVWGEIGVRALSASSQDGLYGVEKVTTTLYIDGRSKQDTFSGTLRARFTQGEMLINPLYFNFSDALLAIDGRWQWADNRLELEDVRLDHSGLQAEFSLAYDLDEKALTELRVKRANGDAAALFSRYIQPFVSDSLLAEATAEGSFFVSLDWRRGKLQSLSALLNQVSLVDGQDRFALKGLDGQLGKDARAMPSSLRIASGHWRGVPVGSSELNVLWDDEGWHLLRPWRVPIMDGALVVEDLQPAGLEEYRLRAKIEPIDVEALSKYLGWPHFRGDISGSFNDVRLSARNLYLQEPVYINIFDGLLSLNDLQIAEIGSPQPLMYFDMDVERIDLQRLTRAFDVGEIRGRLSGYIGDVVLVDWRPIGFEASLETPLDDPGERKVSHEAVQYLSQAGGGAAMVSKFVEVLNQFPYEKLGIHAILDNGVLFIEGVENRDDGGFYLVKGRALPHLNIIGYGNEVGWEDLLARLKAAANSEGAVVQ